MKLEYASQFKIDMMKTIDYIKYNLGNEIASNNLIDEVERKIIERAELQVIYTSYMTRKRYKYYKLRVRNYIIFYTVEDEVMKVRRFLYNRRDFEKIDIMS